MQIHKIELPTPYQTGDVNGYLLKGDTLSLFDPGPRMPKTLEVLKKGIEAAGYSLKDVEQVILTHHHPDHSGWVDAFPHAEILGHEYVDYFLRRDREYIKYRMEFLKHHLLLGGVPEEYIESSINVPGESELFGTLPLTKFIHDGDEIPGHPGLIAYYTPGHAQSHFIFVHEASESAIGGDLLLDKITPNPLVETPVDRSFNRPKYFVQWIESLKLLRKFNLKTLYTGHGKDLENVNEFIDFQIKKNHNRALQVLELLDKPKTLMDLTKELYESLYKKILGLTLSKTLGFLDYLENENYITVEQTDNVNLYRRIK